VGKNVVNEDLIPVSLWISVILNKQNYF